MTTVFGMVACFLSLPAPPDGAQDPSSRQLPPTHWSYRIFTEFAQEGWIPNHPRFAFAGGRVFTRMELAEITSGLIAFARKNPPLVSGERRAQMIRLIGEFQPELRLLGADVGIPEPVPGIPSPPVEGGGGLSLRPYGSLITTITQKEELEEKIKPNPAFNTLTDFNLESSFFRVHAAGQVDNAANSSLERETGDVLQGDFYSFDLTERYAEMFGASGDLSGRWKLGDLRNVTFGRGLTIGAHDSDGILGEGRVGELGQSTFFRGRTESGSTVAGARWEKAWAESPFRSGFHFADIEEGPGAGTYYGGDLFYTDRFFDIALETVQGQDQGNGYLADVLFYYFPTLRFDGAFRRYHKLLLDENNPPIYSGISGGDGEDDLGFRLGVQWSPLSILQLKGKAEQSENLDGSGTLQDLFGEVRLSPWPGATATGSFEGEEEVDVHLHNQLANFSLSQTLGEFSASMAGTRDKRAGTVVDTIRSVLRDSIWDRSLTLEFSHTFQHEVETAKRENIFQPRILWNVTTFFFLFVRYTHSDEPDTQDSFDLTLVVQW